MEKLLCNLLHHRTASISVNSAMSSPFPLHSGVSQGSVLSPTLFSTYTADMPRPADTHCMDIYYADEATKIVTPNGTLEEHDARVMREANRLNTFDKKWKINSNRQIFHGGPLEKLSKRHTSTGKHHHTPETMLHTRTRQHSNIHRAYS